MKLIDILREIKLETTGKWYDYDLKSPDLDSQTLENMFQYYKDAYKAQGLDLSVNSPEELKNDYKAVAMVDVDADKQPDSFIVYKLTPMGKKIALLFSNGKKAAKAEVVSKTIELVKEKSGWFIEASKKMEDILSKSGAPVVYDEKTIKAIIGSKKADTMEMLDNGYYKRELGAVPDTFIVKRIYGRPL